MINLEKEKIQMEKIINKIKDKFFISKQKSRLLTEEKRLKKELDIDNKFPQYGDSEEANASEVTEFTKRQGIEKQLEGELKDVEDALKKIADDKYGICEVCGKKINPERLDAMPSARTCVKCSDK